MILAFIGLLIVWALALVLLTLGVQYVSEGIWYHPLPFWPVLVGLVVVVVVGGWVLGRKS